MTFWKTVRIVREIAGLPKVTVPLPLSDANGRVLLRKFNRPHPRCPLIGFKTIGVGLVDLGSFAGPAEYMGQVSGKNSAAYFGRKATRAGYRFAEIDPNSFVDDIFRINTSLEERQGRPMDASYAAKVDRYVLGGGNRYFGVLKGETLVAYLNLLTCGPLAIVSRILGHGEHLQNGIMYLLLTSVVCRLIEEKSARYLMYDTIFGASDGLALFKRRIGFRAYRVRWIAA